MGKQPERGLYFVKIQKHIGLRTHINTLQKVTWQGIQT